MQKNSCAVTGAKFQHSALFVFRNFADARGEGEPRRWAGSALAAVLRVQGQVGPRGSLLGSVEQRIAAVLGTGQFAVQRHGPGAFAAG